MFNFLVRLIEDITRAIWGWPLYSAGTREVVCPWCGMSWQQPWQERVVDNGTDWGIWDFDVPLYPRFDKGDGQVVCPNPECGWSDWL